MAKSRRPIDPTPRLVRPDRNWKADVLANIRARIGGGVRQFRHPEWAVVQLRSHREHGCVFSAAQMPLTLGRKDLFQPSAFVEILSAATNGLMRVPSGDVEWLQQPAFMTLNFRISLLGGIDQLRTELAKWRKGSRKTALTELIGEYDYERKQRILRRRSAGLLPAKSDWREVSGGRMESNRRRH